MGQRNRVARDSVSPPDDERSSGAASSARYALRDRHTKPPPAFDSNIYNEVFSPSGDYASTPDAASSKKRSRRQRRVNQRKRKRQRRRRGHDDEGEDNVEEEDDVGEDEEEEDGMEEVTAAEDFEKENGELDMEAVTRRIAQQERREKAAAVARAREADRVARPSRYALRSRESDVDPTASGSKLSPLELSGDSHDGGDDAGNDDRDNDADSESHSDNSGDDKHGSDEHESGEHDDSDDDEDTSGRRYHLRRRSTTRHNEQISDNTRAERSHRKRGAGSRREFESAPTFSANNIAEQRYSLRDRSKGQRTDADGNPQQNDPTAAAYAEYHKRQSASNRASTRRVSRGSNRRLFVRTSGRSSRSHRQNSIPHRRRRNRPRSSSSSSSSSSSEMHTYDDSDDGGMRTSSPWRSRHDRKKGSARADISPIEVDGNVTWESVGGLTKHVEALKEMVMLPLLYPEFYEKYNISPPSGVLFYGPPGTGKTLMARALASSCSVPDNRGPTSPYGAPNLGDGEETKPKRRNVTFYMRKGADCLSKWVGEAERQLRLLFEEAKRNEPSIIFFDEIDGLAPVRSAKQDQIHASIVSTLLALMDGMDSRGRVVVIGATNRLDAIDPALRRPGRFDRELGFKLPNVQDRTNILTIHTHKWNPPLSSRFITEIAEQTVGYCGADIKALCAEAALCSLRRVYPQVYGSQDKLLINLGKVVVSRGDFRSALKKVTPASHRSVGSFATPLPREVRCLLLPQLKTILSNLSKQFPMFEANCHGDSKASASKSGDVDADFDDHDDDDIYGIANHDDCDVCHGDSGVLVCCDACPAAFHRACIPAEDADAVKQLGGADDEDGLWFCAECLKNQPNTVEKVRQRSAKTQESPLTFGLPLQAGFPRILLCGKSGMGQEHLGSAILHALEGYTQFSLDYPSLVADSNAQHPEEAMIRRLNEAQKSVPCVIALPHADVWWENTTESMHVALAMMLMNMQAKSNLPILFLAWTASPSSSNLASSHSTSGVPKGLLELFDGAKSVQQASMLVKLDRPSDDARLEHFTQAIATFAVPPSALIARETQKAVLEVLPLAPLPESKSTLPTGDELRRIKERDMHYLRELRIFLDQVLEYCITKKLYQPFHSPVDPMEVPNYYLIIQHPMDLSTMREKLNDEEYTTFEKFMADIQLIVRNANVFNPKHSASRGIAHAAGIMKDNILSYAHRFRTHQGYDLFARCREVTKRVQQNPTVYGKLGRRMMDSSPTGNAAASKKRVGLRASARLRGIKAPELPVETYGHAETAANGQAVASNGESISQQVVANGNGHEDAKSVSQWFAADVDGDSHSETTENNREASIDVGNDNDTKPDAVSDAQDGNGDAEQESPEVFAKGAFVFVSSRTQPGVNKPGGAGLILKRNGDGTYDIKYMLGGRETYVSPAYVKRLTDGAIRDSIKNSRVVQETSTADDADAIGSAGYVHADEHDYFDRLIFPILKRAGWTKETRVEIVEQSDEHVGSATETVVYFPPADDSDDSDDERVALEGVPQAMRYIFAVPELADQCFGSRIFADSLFDEMVGKQEAPPGPSQKEAASSKETDEQTPPQPVAQKKASTPEVEAVEVDEEKTEEKTEEKAEESTEPAHAPDFIYDEVSSLHWVEGSIDRFEG